MGNNQHKPLDSESEEEEIQKKGGKYDYKKIYWDRDGNLRYGLSSRNRDEEIIKILLADSIDEENVKRVWMILPSRWVKEWLMFAHLKVGKEPKKITMRSLLVKDTSVEGGLRPNKCILRPNAEGTEKDDEAPGHYRRITMEAWLKLVELYGTDGPAIAVKGIPYDDKERWRVFHDPANIDVSILPEPVIPDEEEEGEEGDKKGKKDKEEKKQ